MVKPSLSRNAEQTRIDTGSLWDGPFLFSGIGVFEVVVAGTSLDGTERLVAVPNSLAKLTSFQSPKGTLTRKVERNFALAIVALSATSRAVLATVSVMLAVE